MTIVGTYVLAKDVTTSGIIFSYRLIFKVLDEPEPNVIVRYTENGLDFSHLMNGADERDRRTLEQGRGIWRIHVEHGYRRVEE
jgi:hypothetical protein